MSIEYLTSDAEKVNYLCALLKAKATGKESSESEFKQIRHELLSNNSLVTRLPSWLKLTRDLDSFWDFIQPKFSTYQDRRVFLDQEFSELSNQLEFGNRPQIINQPAFKQTNQNISPTTPFVAPATTDSFSGGTGNTYSFTLTSVDDAGNTTTTACVAAGVTIDTDASKTSL